MLERFNDLNNKDKSTLVCGIVVVLMIIFVFSTGFFSKPSVKENNVSSEEINKLFDNVKDNYVININKNINNMNEKIIYYTDNKLELFENDIYEDGVIRYNGNIFCLDSDTMELNQCDSEYNYVYDSFYDFKFIKLLTSDCKYKYISNYKVSCDVSLNSFFRIYNELNNTSYIGNDNNISFDIDYNDLYITKINVDFSDAYNIIYGTNDRFLLNMKLSLGGNDFNKIYEHYKDILEA